MGMNSRDMHKDQQSLWTKLVLISIRIISTGEFTNQEKSGMVSDVVLVFRVVNDVLPMTFSTLLFS